MKKLIITILFLIPATAFPQVIVKAGAKAEDVDINHLPNVKYISLIGQEGLFSRKVSVYIDYGQKLKWGIPHLIRKADGQQMIFQSMMGALNFMDANGWELINITKYTEGQQLVSHFLMKRKE